MCKVRRISEDRSVFVLKDIIKLPEVECRDQLNSNNFDIHFKSPPSQIRFTAHHEDIKSLWLTEIGQYVNDQLALHEHTVDDLRIDPTQVKSDTENDGFRLPHRIEAYVSDGVKPSEIARDYYLPHIEKKTVKAEESEIVVQQQHQHYEQTVQQEHQQQQQAVQHQEQQQTVLQQHHQQQQIVQDKQQQQTVEAKASSVKSEQIVQQSHQATSTTKTVFAEQKQQQISQTVDSQSHATIETKKSTTAVADTQHHNFETKTVEQRSTVQKVEDQQKSIEIKTAEKQQSSRLTRNNAIEQQDSTASATKETTVVDTKSTANTNKQVTPKSGTHCVQIILPETAPPASHNNQIALLPSASNKTHASNPQDADTNQNQSSAGNTASVSGASGGGGGDRNPNRQLYPFQSVSYFNFGDRQGGGGGGDGLPPRSNLPDFLVPPHLITYQTTFEISVRKIPFPDPPTPPKYMKKLVAPTETLEKRTRDFLSARFTSTSTGDALKTARQKMRSLKSMIMLSDDEVRHAEDTIVKAKHGDFQRIYNPYLGAEKPQYEFIELPSEGECSEDTERGTSEQQGQTTMAEQYSSKYSSRSRRTEGIYIYIYDL